MPQFCILFYANYSILVTQRGKGMAQWPAPLNTPLDPNALHLNALRPKRPTPQSPNSYTFPSLHMTMIIKDSSAKPQKKDWRGRFSNCHQQNYY